MVSISVSSVNRVSAGVVPATVDSPPATPIVLLISAPSSRIPRAGLTAPKAVPITESMEAISASSPSVSREVSQRSTLSI